MVTGLLTRSLTCANWIREFTLEETLESHSDQPPAQTLVLEDKWNLRGKTSNRKNYINITHSYQKPHYHVLIMPLLHRQTGSSTQSWATWWGFVSWSTNLLPRNRNRFTKILKRAGLFQPGSAALQCDLLPRLLNGFSPKTGCPHHCWLIPMEPANPLLQNRRY